MDPAHLTHVSHDVCVLHNSDQSGALCPDLLLLSAAPNPSHYTGELQVLRCRAFVR